MVRGLARVLLAAGVASGCIGVVASGVNDPVAPNDGVMKENQIAVQGSDYDASVYAGPNGDVWFGCTLLGVPLYGGVSATKSDDASIANDVFVVSMELQRKSDGAVLVPASVQLVVSDRTYAPTRLRVNRIVALDLAAPIAIGRRTYLTFVFDQPPTPIPKFSLRVPGLPEMTFQRRTVRHWVGC
jgi:hypothetical protein